MIEAVEKFNYLESTSDDKMNLIIDLMKLEDDDLYENLEFIVNELAYNKIFDEYYDSFKYSDKIFEYVLDILNINIVYDTIYKLKKYKKSKNSKKLKKLKKSIISNINAIGDDKLKEYNQYFKYSKVKKLLYSII